MHFFMKLKKRGINSQNNFLLFREIPGYVQFKIFKFTPRNRVAGEFKKIENEENKKIENGNKFILNGMNKINEEILGNKSI